MTELWKLPGPSSGRATVEFHQLGGRECLLICQFALDGSDDFQMTFAGVESYKATFYMACTSQMLEAYDRISNVGTTPWLEEVSAQLSRSGEDSSGLQHLMIYFDDGPCYEFICRSFQTAHSRDPAQNRTE